MVLLCELFFVPLTLYQLHGESQVYSKWKLNKMLKLLEFSVKPLDKIRIYLDKNLFKSINWIKQLSQRSRSKNMLMDSGFWQDAHFGKFSPDSKSCVSLECPVLSNAICKWLDLSDYQNWIKKKNSPSILFHVIYCLSTDTISIALFWSSFLNAEIYHVVFKWYEVIKSNCIIYKLEKCCSQQFSIKTLSVALHSTPVTAIFQIETLNYTSFIQKY